MVTYLAHTGEKVSETGDNIVYIGQKTLDSTATSADFEYTISGNIGTGTYATVKYGSSADTIEATGETVAVGSVTITGSNYEIVSGDTNVGLGDTSDLKFKAEDGYEIIDLRVVGQKSVDPEAAMVTVKAGDEVVIVTAATNAPAVYQLVGAKVELDENFTYEKVTEKGTEKVYTNSGIVRVIGSVDKVYFVFKDGDTTYTMDGVSEFAVNDINKSGYYGVEIEDKVDVSNYSVEAHAVVVNAEGAEEEIDVTKIQ
jgi:hypothetical protein